MTKIYRLRRRYAAYFETLYCGVPVQLIFQASIGLSGENIAELTTSDRFTQDAIEHDPRFGKEFYLAEQFGEPEPEPEPVEEEVEPAPKKAVKGQKSKVGGQKAKAEGQKAKVEEKVFKTINDAIYYLEEELGIETEDKDIDALLKENNITVKE